MARKLVDAGMDMNRIVVALASAVIVHSREAFGRLGPNAAAKTFVVPHGAEPLTRTADRAAVRASIAAAVVSEKAEISVSTHRLEPGVVGIVRPVVLMPEGLDTETLRERALWIVELCKANGWRYSPRLHVDIWGNRRGV